MTVDPHTALAGEYANAAGLVRVATVSGTLKASPTTKITSHFRGMLSSLHAKIVALLRAGVATFAPA